MPNEPRIKDVHQRDYYERHGRPMLLDYVNAELIKQASNRTNNHHVSLSLPFFVGISGRERAKKKKKR